MGEREGGRVVEKGDEVGRAGGERCESFSGGRRDALSVCNIDVLYSTAKSNRLLYRPGYFIEEPPFDDSPHI